MRAEPSLRPQPYRVVLLTLDQHAAGPAARAAPRLARDFPGLTLEIHAAAEWGERPAALVEARAAVARADLLIVTLLFLDEHLRAILPDLEARRGRCDALVAMVADPSVVRLTRMGDLDMARPASGLAALLKKLRPKPTGAGGAGASHMKMLRRLPRLLKLVPGRAQDLRQWFLSMQYWLDGSEGNVENLVRSLVSRYAAVPAWRRTAVAPPVEHPEVGLYHPDLPGAGIALDAAELPSLRNANAAGTVGVLMLRSYVLAGDTAHYDAVIRALEARGLGVIPAFAGGLDGRPAIAAYMDGGRADALLSLTGFSLVGGPAYNDSAAAAAVLGDLDLPYVNAQPLEFQTLGQWAASAGGLGPIEATMLLALPEIDGAVAPTVFAGRHGAEGCAGCARRCRPDAGGDAPATGMAPCPERIDALAGKVQALVALRRKRNADKTVAVVLFGFPPNAGAAGTAAYLDVFASLHATLRRMAAEGYDLVPPASVEELRAAVLGGGAAYGQEASIASYLSADRLVAELPHLSEIEAAWGPAPGRAQSDGRGVFVLGAQFGRVFVGLQPAFGYEGDPMRLLFERGFAPTHAFAGFYHWLRHDLAADVILHFGMHGALEFMPGKQAGLSGADWPDRLIGAIPNVYLYAANNPSEATLAKRRSNAVTVTHLTPPLASAGLYKGLAELKDSLGRWRAMDPSDPARAELGALVAEQAAGVDMDAADLGALWSALVEAEAALIPEGLHVLGRAPTAEARARMVALMDGADAPARARAEALLAGDHELPGLMRALSARFVPPVPGGDLVRNPDVLPSGRNIHAFDPFRMPTAFAMRQGAAQARLLVEAHAEAHGAPPRSVALVLWGSDNIKSDGVPIAQALALMGCAPRFDAWGRLAGAELAPLAELGRPRIDVVVTLSGIFRDLLPLQTRLLAEAALICAEADEPLERNHVRAHAVAHMASVGCDLRTAALRVFSNAEGVYGSNVNHLVDAGAFEDEDELADAYEARKGFAYGADGRAAAQPAVLAAALAGVDLAYQNLESVELGITSVDHYFDTLGGIARAARRAKGGGALPVYIGDATRGTGKVRTLAAQVALETRSRSLNPRFYEPLLGHGAQGVRQIEAHVTNTLGWSATTGQVDPWVYQRLSETFVLDAAMRERLAALNPQASARMAGRLIEAAGRRYWAPDEATLAGLHAAADAIEDRLEGIAAE